jgi:tetratricopeptide (TPR) repeat protein
LIPLAILGIALAAKRSKTHALLLVALLAQAVFVLAFFVTTRYRLALWTSAIPYAAYALSALPDVVRGRSRLPRAALLAPLALVISNLGVSAEPATHAAFEHDHMGALLDKAGEHEAAVRHWQTALAIDPRYAQAHFQLAHDAAKRTDLTRAAAHYEAGLRAAPATFAARIAYAGLLIKLARSDEATRQLRRVLEDVASPRVRASVCGLAHRSKLDLRPDC